MKDVLLQQQFSFRLNPLANAEKELSILVIKPGFKVEFIQKVHDFITLNKLKLICEYDFLFDKSSLLAIYNDIYRFTNNDIKFGLEWKQRKIVYMTSESSRIFIVSGPNAQSLSEAFKYRIRDKYKKLSIPDRKLSPDEFEELAIKNIIHVVDESDIEVALWLLT